jgi:hypothetical protein
MLIGFCRIALALCAGKALRDGPVRIGRVAQRYLVHRFLGGGVTTGMVLAATGAVHAPSM